MKKDIFKERVLKEVKTFVGFRYPNEKVKVEACLNNKVNEVKEGIGIFVEGCGGPVFYFEDLYEQFKKSLSFEDFISHLTGEINKHLPALHNTDAQRAIEKIDASYILANAVPVLVNTAANQELFNQRNLVHKDLPDLGLSVIFQVEVKIGDNQGVIKVTKQMIKAYEISEEKLYRFSFKNLRRNNPIIMEPLTAKLFGLGLPQAKDITLISANNGFAAAYILCDDIMQDLCKMYEGDIFIFPSSLNEVLITQSEDDCIEEKKKVVSEISTDPKLTPKEIFLSDRLMKYDKDTHWLYLV